MPTALPRRFSSRRLANLSVVSAACLSCLVGKFIFVRTFRAPAIDQSTLAVSQPVWGLSSGRPVALVVLRLKGCRHVPGDAQLEMVFRSKPTDTCCGQMNIVFAGPGIGMIHFAAFLVYAVAEIPAIGERRIAAPAVGRKPKRGSRICSGRVIGRE